MGNVGMTEGEQAPTSFIRAKTLKGEHKERNKKEEKAVLPNKDEEYSAA